MAVAKPNPAQPKPEKKKGGISLMVVLLLILVAGGGGAAGVWFLGPKKAAAAGTDAAEAPAHGEAAHDEHGGDAHGAATKKPGATEYISIDPTFVVNTADEDTQHYLQTDVQVMSHDGAVADQIKMHMPRIRNNLLLLFSAQRCADVRDRAGREKLQAAALKEVQDVLQSEIGKPGVEALYFTSFVTQ
jgi:flagellar FliL protein